MKTIIEIAVVFISICNLCCGQDQSSTIFKGPLPAVVTENRGIALWPEGQMPFDNISPRPQQSYNDRGHVQNVSRPEMYFCPAKGDRKSDACVIVCPGGGYGIIALVYEGFATADNLTAKGINVFVLSYRHSPYRQRAPLADVQRAIRLVRRDAASYGISPDKIGIMGYSAGGHLAATASTMYNEQLYTLDDDKNISARPDFSILIYPVITMGEKTHGGSRDNLLGSEQTPELIAKYSCEQNITADTPPTFLVHASDDGGVPVANSIMYYQSLIAHGVDAELHIYNKGGHGFSIAGRPGETSAQWTQALDNWGMSLARNVLDR